MWIVERIGSREKEFTPQIHLSFEFREETNCIAFSFSSKTTEHCSLQERQILLLSKSTITANSLFATKLTSTRNKIKQQNTVEYL